jgi:hypothetical protein
MVITATTTTATTTTTTTTIYLIFFQIVVWCVSDRLQKMHQRTLTFKSAFVTGISNSIVVVTLA